MGLSPAPKRRLVDADTTTHAEPPPTPLSPMAPMCRASWGSFTNLLQHCANAKAAGHSGSDHNLPTDTEQALKRFDAACEHLVKELKKRVVVPTEAAFFEEEYTYARLRGCVFVGHVNTDLDSIAGAVGAAELFGGVACRSEDGLNGEITHALEVAGLEAPPLFDTTPGAGVAAADGSRLSVCLVDHNEPKQMVASLRDDPQRAKRIVGLIDHHALAEGFSSAGPLTIDVRPWGSMSSIVAHLYVRLSAKMRPAVARLLMCAILSDTLNLQSVTTTDADRFAVALLAKQGGVESPDSVARQMFRHKTRWIVGLGPYQMARGDQKDFSVDGWKFGISVLEVTDTSPVLAIADQLLLELRILKKEKGKGDVKQQLDFAFLFVVDVVQQRSKLLVCGGREYALASAAFPGCGFTVAKEGLKAPGTTVRADQTLCHVGPLVSRKAQFVPAFSHVLAEGFSCHRTRVTDPQYAQGKSGEALDKVLAAGQAKVQYAGPGLKRNMSRANLALYEQSTSENAA